MCLPILGQVVCRWSGSPQEKHRRAPGREGQPSGATSGWAGNGQGPGAMGLGALAAIEAVVLEAVGV